MGRLQATRDKTKGTNHPKRDSLASIADMSHELRTPLHTIIGFSEELASVENLRMLTEQEIVEFAGYIHQAGHSLLGMINNLLDLSKIEAGYLTLNKEEFCLHDVYLITKPILMQQAESKGLSLRIEGDDPVVCADYQRISQVMMNLVGNAIKFTERGGVTVQISSAETEITVSVIDTGIGIHEGMASNPLSASALERSSSMPVFQRWLSGGDPFRAFPSPHFCATYCLAACLLSS